jgi:hypothetical protein
MKYGAKLPFVTRVRVVVREVIADDPAGAIKAAQRFWLNRVDIGEADRTRMFQVHDWRESFEDNDINIEPIH